MRAPDPPNERERLQALRRYDVLDTPPEQAFEDLTLLASQICDVPIALVSLVDGDRQWFKSERGLGVTEMSRELAFCGWVVADGEMLVVPDAEADGRFRENPLVTDDPGIRFYAGAPLTTDDGLTLGTICAIDRRPRELDDRQRAALQALARQAMAQLELRRQNSALRDLDRLKDEFVGGVSHELRTPLTSIRGYVETLLEGETGPLNDDQRRFLGIVDRNAQRLLTLVGDLLFIAQVNAGRLQLHTAPHDLDGLVRDAVEHAAPAARAKGIELVVESSAVEATVDAQRVAQLLDNLVSNAVKFTPGGGRVEVGLERLDGHAHLVVRDSGIGIPAADVPLLFERFTRASNAHAVPGTGLGLAVSKTIVDAHGGRIAVDSREGAGTTFEVVLPL